MKTIFTPSTYLILGYTPKDQEELNKRIMSKPTTPTIPPIKILQTRG